MALSAYYQLNLPCWGVARHSSGLHSLFCIISLSFQIDGYFSCHLHMIPFLFTCSCAHFFILISVTLSSQLSLALCFIALAAPYPHPTWHCISACETMKALNKWQFTPPPSNSPDSPYIPATAPASCDPTPSELSLFQSSPPSSLWEIMGEQVNVLAVWDTLMTFGSSMCFTAADLRGAVLQSGREGKRGKRKRDGESERETGAHGDDAAKEEL